MSDWERLCKFLGTKFSGKKKIAQGKVLLALVGDLNDTALTLMQKDLSAVVH